MNCSSCPIILFLQPLAGHILSYAHLERDSRYIGNQRYFASVFCCLHSSSDPLCIKVSGRQIRRYSGEHEIQLLRLS